MISSSIWNIIEWRRLLSMYYLTRIGLGVRVRLIEVASFTIKRGSAKPFRPMGLPSNVTAMKV